MKRLYKFVQGNNTYIEYLYSTGNMFTNDGCFALDIYKRMSYQESAKTKLHTIYFAIDILLAKEI